MAQVGRLRLLKRIHISGECDAFLVCSWQCSRSLIECQLLPLCQLTTSWFPGGCQAGGDRGADEAGRDPKDDGAPVAISVAGQAAELAKAEQEAEAGKFERQAFRVSERQEAEKAKVGSF